MPRFRKKYVLKIFAFSLVVLFVTLQLYSNYSGIDSDRFKMNQILHTNFSIKNDLDIRSIDQNGQFIFGITKPRLNNLLSILAGKENEYESIFSKLHLLVFKNLLNSDFQSAEKKFKLEIERNLEIVNNRIQVTTQFVESLNNMSQYYSFISPRNHTNQTAFAAVCLLLKYLIFIIIKKY
jgi:hypothetical protein